MQRNKSPSKDTQRLATTGLLIITLTVVTAKYVTPNNWQTFATIVTSYGTLAYFLFGKGGKDNKSEKDAADSD